MATSDRAIKMPENKFGVAVAYSAYNGYRNEAWKTLRIRGLRQGGELLK